MLELLTDYFDLITYVITVTVETGDLISCNGNIPDIY